MTTRTIGGFEFPDPDGDGLEATVKAWKPATRRIALHRKVLAFAKTRIEGKWNAYCFPVEGVNHDIEEHGWEEHGSKLSPDVAKAMFPMFREIPYAL